jgi:hypothetical protein
LVEVPPWLLGVAGTAVDVVFVSVRVNVMVPIQVHPSADWAVAMTNSQLRADVALGEGLA